MSVALRRIPKEKRSKVTNELHELRQKLESEIKLILDKTMHKLIKQKFKSASKSTTTAFFAPMSLPKRNTLKHAVDLLHDVTETSSEASLAPRMRSRTAEKLSELLSSIKPFIYGRTPTSEGLWHSLKMFKDTTSCNRNKVIFFCRTVNLQTAIHRNSHKNIVTVM